MDRFRAFSFDTMVQRLEIDFKAFRSVPTRILVGTSSLIFLMLMLASLSISRFVRAYTRVTCKHTAWCDARTTTKDFWHPHSTCATCVPSGRLHEPTTGTSMFHTIVIGSFMKIILGIHYTLSFVLTHCNLIALNKAAHILLLHSFM